MKIIKALAIVAVAMFATACTKVVPVKQNEIAFELNSDGTWDEKMYSGDNIMLDDWCSKYCDDAHVFEAHHEIVNIPGEYAMPKSNDMDLTLELDIKVTLDKRGGAAAIRERAMASAKRYKFQVTGGTRDNQVFRTPIAYITSVDLNPAAVKSKIRPILEPLELSQAYYNIAKNGDIFDKMRKAVEDHLSAIGSPLMVLEVQVKRIAQPEELLSKKKREEGLLNDDRIQKKELDMKERRMNRLQLIRMKETLNELELLAVQQEFMTPRTLAYGWQQTANRFADMGIPFAVDPSMLLAALDKTTRMSINEGPALDAFKKRIATVEAQVAAESECDAAAEDGSCDDDEGKK